MVNNDSNTHFGAILENKKNTFIADKNRNLTLPKSLNSQKNLEYWKIT